MVRAGVPERPSTRSRLDPGLSTLLDHVRWLAAFLVLLAHLRLDTIGSYASDLDGARGLLVRAFFSVTGLGREAVVAFFVLSGVLVAGKLLGEAHFGRAECTRYLLDRLTRIWIVALPALLFSALVAVAAQRAFGGFDSGLAGVCAPTLLDLIANLLFLHKAFFPTLCSDPPYWSIHNEVWYYLLLPAILLIFTARAGWLRLIMLALVTAALGALLLFDPWDSKNTLAYGPLWLAGGVIAAGWRWRWRLSPALAASLLLLALVIARAAPGWPFLLRDYLVGLALLALLLAVQGRGLPAWWLRPGLVRSGRRLAGCSYSLYLTHAPVISLIRTVLEHGFGIALPIRAVNAPALAIMLLEGLAALAVACLFYLAFERHTGALRATIRARLDHHRDLFASRPVPEQSGIRTEDQASSRAIRASQAS